MKDYPRSAVWSVTDQCNFRCPYCFVHHSPRKSSFEIGDQLCQFLLKDAEEKPALWFFGGEPMLEWKNIILPLLKKYNNEINWGMTSNGSLWTEDVVDTLKEYKVNLLLSIDGGEVVQNKNRPLANGKPSFPLVIKNIPYLLLQYPDITFRSTLTPFSIYYMNDTYDFAEHMGFKQISMVIDEGDTYTEDDFKELKRQYHRMAIKMLNGHSLLIEDFSKFPMYIRQPCMDQMRCGYGTTSFGVTVEGEITPCQELNSFEGIVIGNIWTGIDSLLLKEFLNKVNVPIQIPDGLDMIERRFIENGVCPKHFYFDSNFKVTKGREYQLRALADVYRHMQVLCEGSGNDMYRRFAL